MRKYYDGLDVFKISINTKTPTKSTCVAMIQLKLENGICISPDYQQQIEWIGDKDEP